MKGYNEIAKLYDKKFLNYIISRSKKINYKWGMEYEDLVSEGLLKLVELHSEIHPPPDKRVMIALVHMFNDIEERQQNGIHPMSIDDFPNI